VKATGAQIREFIDNGWPGGEAGEFFYEGFDGDEDSPDIWNDDGDFALDLATEYDLSVFGYIIETSTHREEPFEDVFKAWHEEATRTHDLLAIVIRVPRDTVTHGQVVALVQEMIDGTIHHDSWGIVT
jgi:hypothetical protein